MVWTHFNHCHSISICWQLPAARKNFFRSIAYDCLFFHHNTCNWDIWRIVVPRFVVSFVSELFWRYQQGNLFISHFFIVCLWHDASDESDMVSYSDPVNHVSGNICIIRWLSFLCDILSLWKFNCMYAAAWHIWFYGLFLVFLLREPVSKDTGL